ncbi:MAG: glycosyltransferase family 4 protein [Candidatus Krumholzibacteriia bacterium]
MAARDPWLTPRGSGRAAHDGRALRMILDVVLVDDARVVAGGERCLLILAGELTERGHRVRVAARRRSGLADAAAAAGHDVVPVRFGRGLRQFTAALELVRALRPRPPQVLHSHADGDRTTAAVAARILRAICVASVHSDQSVERNPFQRWRNRRLVHRFLPVSHAGAERLLRQDRLPPSLVTVVPNGIVDSPAPDREEARAALRHELGLAEDALLVVAAGRLTRFKGHDVLIAAAERVLAEVPEARFLIAGEGERRADLAAQIAAAGLQEQVRLLGHRSDVPALLAASHVVAQPSRAGGGEACPLTVLEAMAASRPVVATDAGDLRRMVAGAGAGLVVPPEQPEALAAALVELLRDAPGRRHRGRAGRARFLARHTAGVMTDAVLAVYQELLDRRSRF